jgi:hypothetical protein
VQSNISKLSFIETPSHALISVKNTFQWGGKKHKCFDTLEENISTTPIFALSNIQQPFEIETNANGYAMGPVFMKYCKPIYYHSETSLYVQYLIVSSPGTISK